MATLLVLAANLLPLTGVWFWGWDAFLILMIYWAETVIVAGWTLARIATMPGQAGEKGPGSIIINAGKTAFFALHAGIFIAVHLFFLLTVFSGEWKGRARGAMAFFDALFIDTGAWVALLLTFVAGLIGFVAATPRPTVVTWVLRRISGPGTAGALDHAGPDEDHLNPVIGGLYTRIIVLQVGIIFGALLAEAFGTRGPLMIVIVLKTLVELRIWSPWAQTAAADQSAQKTNPPAQQ